MSKVAKELVNKWANNIKQKTFTFLDTYSIGTQINLQNLLNQVLKIDKQNDTVNSQNWYNGFHFLFANQNNLMIGSDGYDNYQAPTDLNNKVDHQLFLRRLWVKGDLNFIASPQINSTLKCIENVKNVRYLNDNAFVSIERKFYELNNLGQYKDPNLIENRVMMYTNDLYHQQQPQDSPKDIVPSNLQHKIYFKLTSIDLLKYSMLTYNLHKIHYDYKYSNCIENLPNLLVHGPFQITLLLYYFQCKYPNQVIKSFTYRTFNPCFCNTEVGIAINELDTLKEQKGSNEEKYELSLVSADSKTVYMKGTLLCCKT